MRWKTKDGKTVDTSDTSQVSDRHLQNIHRMLREREVAIESHQTWRENPYIYKTLVRIKAKIKVLNKELNERQLPSLPIRLEKCTLPTLVNLYANTIPTPSQAEEPEIRQLTKSRKIIVDES